MGQVHSGLGRKYITFFKKKNDIFAYFLFLVKKNLGLNPCLDLMNPWSPDPRDRFRIHLWGKQLIENIGLTWAPVAERSQTTRGWGSGCKPQIQIHIHKQNVQK